MENDLNEMLERLLKLNESLFQSLQVERECLTGNDMEGLSRVNVEQLELSEQINKVEKSRQKFVGLLKAHFKIEGEEVRLDMILEHLDPEETASLKQKQNDLKLMLAKVMKARELNNRLIEKLLVFNDKNIRLLMGIGNKKLTYDEQGSVQESKNQLLDSVV